MKYWPSQQWHFPYDRILRQLFPQNWLFQFWELVQIKYSGRWDEIVFTGYIELNKHDNVNTNWLLMKELKACMGDEALKKKLHLTDPHTKYIFEKGFSKKMLPWSNRARVTENLLDMQILNFRYADIKF